MQKGVAKVRKCLTRSFLELNALVNARNPEISRSILSTILVAAVGLLRVPVRPVYGVKKFAKLTISSVKIFSQN
eukprot:COSAG01_NODE_277_length_19582_cov_28.126726_3_plen_74_part_00